MCVNQCDKAEFCPRGFTHLHEQLNIGELIHDEFYGCAMQADDGLHPSNINPLTIVKTFQSVCLPRGLYGCELWSNITSRELHMLEVTLRFCAKYMQHFIKVRGPFVQTLCIEKDTYMDAIKRVNIFR